MSRASGRRFLSLTGAQVPAWVRAAVSHDCTGFLPLFRTEEAAKAWSEAGAAVLVLTPREAEEERP